MDPSEFCPICEHCSVYQNKVTHNEIIGLTYRILYCQQANKKYKICKRYQTYIKTGKLAPYNILPNSSFSIDQIVSCIGS
jgi:uncharacterized cysteine cluster protein YcgN (CxxCxxCC family)